MLQITTFYFHYFFVNIEGICSTDFFGAESIILFCLCDVILTSITSICFSPEKLCKFLCRLAGSVCVHFVLTQMSCIWFIMGLIELMGPCSSWRAHHVPTEVREEIYGTSYVTWQPSKGPSASPVRWKGAVDNKMSHYLRRKKLLALPMKNHCQNDSEMDNFVVDSK